MSKGQFTIEFMLLFVLAFFVFLVLLFFVNHYVVKSTEDIEHKKLSSLAEAITKDIMLAQESESQFESTLIIPNKIEGVDVHVILDSQADIIYVRSDITNKTVYRYLPDVEGSLLPGCNRILKENDKIKIDQSC